MSDDKVVTMQMREVSTERKVEVIGMTIQEASENGFINPMLLEILFRVNILLTYLDIGFTKEQKADKLALYDIMIKSGMWDKFIVEMERVYPGEMDNLWGYAMVWSEKFEKYATSFAGTIETLRVVINQLMQDTELNMEALKDVNLGELSQVIPLAKDLGMDFEKK